VKFWVRYRLHYLTTDLRPSLLKVPSKSLLASITSRQSAWMRTPSKKTVSKLNSLSATSKISTFSISIIYIFVRRWRIRQAFGRDCILLRQAGWTIYVRR